MRPTSGKIITEEIAPFHQIIVDVADVAAVVVVDVVVDVVVIDDDEEEENKNDVDLQRARSKIFGSLDFQTEFVTKCRKCIERNFIEMKLSDELKILFQDDRSTQRQRQRKPLALVEPLAKIKQPLHSSGKQSSLLQNLP